MNDLDLLPVFVYGTLRTDHGNWDWALRGRTASSVEATLANAQMYSRGGFPYVVATDNAEETILGEVMYIDPVMFAATMVDLDRLEGYTPGSAHNHYDRKVVEVVTADGTKIEAYTYLASARIRDHVITMPHIPSGDWNVYCGRAALQEV